MSDESQLWEDRYWTGPDGLRLHYRDYGGDRGAVPLLCLHGLTRNARDFAEVAERHAGNRRVIVPDFRGRGLSDRDPVPDRYAPPFYAQEVLGLLDVAGVHRAVFLGTSLGGLVTMIVAAIAPQRIAGAILNDVGPELDPAGLARIAGYVGRIPLFRTWDEATEAVAQSNRIAFPHYGPADWMRMAQRLCRETSDGIVFDYDPAIAINFERAQSAPSVDAWPLIDALAPVPLLILRGETSDILSPATASAMAQRHPHAELVTVPGVGHAPDLGEPEAAGAIDRMIERVDLLEAERKRG